jgi:hypothetical protein
MKTAKASLLAISEMVDRQCHLVVVEKIVIPVRISIVEFRVNVLSTIY